MDDREIILNLLDVIKNNKCSNEIYAKGLHLVYIDDAPYLKKITEARLQNILNNLTTDKVISIEHCPISHKEALKKAQDYFQSTFLSTDRYEEPPEGTYDQDYYNYLRSYGFRKLENFKSYYEQKSRIYEIKYSPDGRIVFIDHKNNSSTTLRKTQADSTPDNIFCYISKNSRKKIKIKDILDKQDISGPVDIHKILYGLGFKGRLKDIFFRVSKTSIYFKNPVYKKDIE